MGMTVGESVAQSAAGNRPFIRQNPRTKTKKKSLENVMFSRLSLVAGVGFEPHDLRVMRASDKTRVAIHRLGRAGA